MAVKLVEPPAVTRGRGPSVNMDDVRALAEQSEQGWATIEGDTHKDQKSARMASAKWKRWVQQMNDDRKIRARVWQDGKTWVWAIHSEEPTT